MKIGKLIVEALLAEARAAAPNECCGLLLGQGDTVTAIRPSANVHPDPATRFEIDPRGLIDAHRAARAGGPAVLGCYHSHPAGPPEPSATDAALAAADGKLWAITGRDAAGDWTVRLWRSAPGGFRALPSPSTSG